MGNSAPMMRRIRAFGAFWYGFIVGDDWRVVVVYSIRRAARRAGR